MELYLIKLGGSYITDKDKPYTARRDRIKKIVNEIAQLRPKLKNIDIVVGHGGGSFPHQSASKYRTVEGFTSKNGAFGACLVHSDALKLHGIVLEESISVGLPVFSFMPGAFLTSKNKIIKNKLLETFSVALTHGLIPLTFGDVILDSQLGSTIYSTERLFSILAKYFNQKKTYRKINIIQIGNSTGVLDKYGKLITKITKNSYNSYKDSIKSSVSTDVTGGMQLKVLEALGLTKLGVRTYIISGKASQSLKKVFFGPSKLGTVIE